jgi:hypothetical protein
MKLMEPKDDWDIYADEIKREKWGPNEDCEIR